MSSDVVIEMPTDLNKHHLEHDTTTIYPKHNGIIALTVDIDSTNAPGQVTISQKPSRWRTPEFYFYAVAFTVVVPIMIWKPVALSQRMYSEVKFFI